jgi:serine/threonine protein kinase
MNQDSPLKTRLLYGTPPPVSSDAAPAPVSGDSGHLDRRDPKGKADEKGPIDPLDTQRCSVCGLPAGSQSFCPRDGTLFQPGFTIGERYTIEGLIGVGGMGFVFEAKHTLLGKRVALKLLRPDLAQNADHVTRFLREAKLSSQLAHPNVVSVSDFGRDKNNHIFLVMELLVGRSLADAFEDGQASEPRAAFAIIRQICRALEAAHSAGIAHRDLTPRNIFLAEISGRSDCVKLLDFGISRLLGDQDRVTSTGVAVGTTIYMPPEQLRGQPSQDHRVDLYALGVIAYQLFTGELPFLGENAAELIAEKLSAHRPDLSTSTLSTRAPALVQLLSECLDPDPQRRPSSAAEVEQRLFSSGSALPIKPRTSPACEREATG